MLHPPRFGELCPGAPPLTPLPRPSSNLLVELLQSARLLRRLATLSTSERHSPEDDLNATRQVIGEIETMEYERRDRH